jgi:RecA-family ATPase
MRRYWYVKFIIMKNLNIKNYVRPRTANERMNDALNQPKLKKLFGDLWYEGELHIMFSDNNKGKSILGFQIADSIARGSNAVDELPNELEKSTVIYYDFEMQDRQFSRRYTANDNCMPYSFPDNLYIENPNIGQMLRENNKSKREELIFGKIEDDIITLNPRVIIIDNLSCLNSASAHEANVAMEIITRLNDLKLTYNISILTLAHTPKVDQGSALSKNQLAGSKKLSDLSDSISAIGSSMKESESDIRYLKQLKCRMDEMKYESNNVLIFSIDKDHNFLKFKFEDFGHENDLIQFNSLDQSSANKESLKPSVMQLRAESKSIREIAAITGVGKSTIERWLKDWHIGNNLPSNNQSNAS